MSVIIDGNEIFSKIQDNIKVQVKNCMIRPSVAVIQVGDDVISNYFVNQKEKTCSGVGVYFRLYKFEPDTPELTIINKIKELNNDEYVNGIIVQLPLPPQYNEKRLLNSINNGKDVEGVTDINIGRFVNGKKSLIPPVALAVVKVLENNEIDISGKNAVVIGRSKNVGKPIANILLSKDATVTVCHTKTNNLSDITKNADIVVSACGVPNLITKDMVKEDSIVIDVGMNGFNKNICGDVDEKVKDNVSVISPIPNGVDVVSNAMLLENILLCYNSKKAK